MNNLLEDNIKLVEENRLLKEENAELLKRLERSAEHHTIFTRKINKLKEEKETAFYIATNMYNLLKPTKRSCIDNEFQQLFNELF